MFTCLEPGIYKMVSLSVTCLLQMTENKWYVVFVESVNNMLTDIPQN